jgi:oligopeptide transport system substrate-binding protein
MKKLLVSITALAAFGLASVASAEMVLNRGGGDNPGSLDPHQISGTWESDIARDQFMGLYTEAADGTIIPGAALSHTVSSDGLTYTFTLRDHNWSDGTPVTAADFEFAFKRILDPATAADYAYLMHIIAGGAEFNGGEGSMDAVGVKAIDDKTLEVTLASAAPYFIAQTTHNTAYPVPKHAVEKFGGDWARPENIVVNGAFKVDSWVIGEKLTVRKNPGFYDAANVALDAVNYFPIKEETAELNLYREGGLDVTYNMPADIIDEIKAEFGDEVMITPYGGTYYYSFNATKEPFNNVDVRRALSMAIDRDFITTVVNTSGIIPAYSFVPSSLPGYKTQNPAWAAKSYDERMAMAADLLAGAGYGTDSPLKVQLRYNTNEGHKAIALAVSDMWSKLGVQVELFNTDARTHYDDLQKQDFQVGRAGWIWDYPDAENLLALMASGKSYNYGQYSNAEFDALLDASYQQSGQERIDTMQKAEAIAMDEAALAPIYYYNSKHLVASYVSGYVANGDDRHPSRWITVSE